MISWFLWALSETHTQELLPPFFVLSTIPVVMAFVDIIAHLNLSKVVQKYSFVFSSFIMQLYSASWPQVYALYLSICDLHLNSWKHPIKSGKQSIWGYMSISEGIMLTLNSLWHKWIDGKGVGREEGNESHWGNKACLMCMGLLVIFS